MIDNMNHDNDNGNSNNNNNNSNEPQRAKDLLLLAWKMFSGMIYHLLLYYDIAYNVVCW